MDFVLSLLDQAAEAFRTAAGDAVPGRSEQFESHMATVRMVVEHAAEEAEKAKEAV